MATTISRKTLSDEVAQKLGISKQVAEQAVGAALDGILDHMRAGNTVKFRGFGAFKPVVQVERVGRNPKTGETVRIAGGTRIKFKAAKGAL